MWVKTWNMKEGFLVGGGLLFAGLLLQVAMGPIRWELFAWPVNLIVLFLLLAIVGVIFALRRKVYAFEWMMHADAAVPCLVYATTLTIIMGLLPQVREGGMPWLSQMLRFWPFVLIWTWMMIISALAALNHIFRWKAKEIPFILNHLGVVVAIVAATLGSADTQSLHLTAFTGEPEWRAVDDNGTVHEPGLGIELHKFTLEEYDDGTPKRFASDITVYTKDGKTVQGTVEVNKPLKANGWKIYQYDYEVKYGTESHYSVFQLVRDPWIPWVYIGIFMMIAGALCLMLFMAPRQGLLKRTTVVIGFVVMLALVFLALTWFKSGLRLRNLMPALQSPWFAPHVIVYMFSYALLGAATIMAVYMLIRKGKTTEKEINLTDNLVYVGLAFLTFGMLFGALWAKEAWGTYWAWDPKETWAAATWLCYLVYLHLRKAKPGKWQAACVILLVSFVCLQICWWGINYLPSAQGLSIHTYNVQ